jgi:hypothetical protein
MKVRWNDKEEPVEQVYQPDSCTLENLVITIRDATTKEVKVVRHTAVSGHPSGDYHLEIQVQ